MTEYSLDSCGWKRCKLSSAIIFYSVVGLCDKHTEEWFKTKPEFDTPQKAAKYIVSKYCKKEVKDAQK